MTAESAKKQRWIQIHLSTAILLMLLAASLLWANLYIYKFWKVEMVPGEGEIQFYAQGWPSQYRVIEGNVIEENTSALIGLGIAFNSAIALAILAATAFTCEWYTRRRERKQQEPGA